MTDPNPQETVIDATQARLRQHIDGLNALRENAEVAQYAADEYIGDAIDSLEAAVADVEQARNDTEDTQP